MAGSVSVTHDTIADVEPLDNPAWYALTGPQSRFAQTTGVATRYDPDVGTFAAFPDDASAQAWSDLRSLVGPGGFALLFRTDGNPELPPGWNVGMRIPCLQMVATAAIGAADPEFGTLGEADVAEMLDLVQRTRPGPFFRRTHELGTYLGLRDDEGLAAMAGERMHLPGFTEISAVCTDERARKRGLATRLVRAIAAGIEARAETPILHVAAENVNAIRVYEALGFATRAAFDVPLVQAPE
jgi:ribosomal protein S18 acetylase RimI-like enzyme